MSPSVGKRTQFRHIFVTMFSRSTMICCVQYWMRHGLLVKTAPGMRSRNSAVMQSGNAGLKPKWEQRITGFLFTFLHPSKCWVTLSISHWNYLSRNHIYSVRVRSRRAQFLSILGGGLEMFSSSIFWRGTKLDVFCASEGCSWRFLVCPPIFSTFQCLCMPHNNKKIQYSCIIQGQ